MWIKTTIAHPFPFFLGQECLRSALAFLVKMQAAYFNPRSHGIVIFLKIKAMVFIPEKSDYGYRNPWCRDTGI